MAGKQISLLFGVLGGGNVSGASGNKIKEDIASIVSTINGSDAVKIKPSVDSKSLNNIRKSIERAVRLAYANAGTGGIPAPLPGVPSAAGGTAGRKSSVSAYSEDLKQAQSSMREFMNGYKKYLTLSDKSPAQARELQKQLIDNISVYKKARDLLVKSSPGQAKSLDAKMVRDFGVALNSIKLKYAELNDARAAKASKSAESDRNAELDKEANSVKRLIADYVELKKQADISKAKNGADSQETKVLESQRVKAKDKLFTAIRAADKSGAIEFSKSWKLLVSRSNASKDSLNAGLAKLSDTDRTKSLNAEERAIDGLIAKYFRLSKAAKISEAKNGAESKETKYNKKQAEDAQDALEKARVHALESGAVTEDAFRKKFEQAEKEAARSVGVEYAKLNDARAAKSIKGAESERDAELDKEANSVKRLIADYVELKKQADISKAKNGADSQETKVLESQRAKAKDKLFDAMGAADNSGALSYSKSREMLAASLRTTADETEIAVARINDALSKPAPDRAISTLQAQLEQYLSVNTKLAKTSSGETLRGFIDELSRGDVSAKRLEDIRSGFSKIKAETKALGLEGKTLGDRLGAAFVKFGGWSIVTRSMMSAVRMVRQMVSTVSELDEALTNFQIVTKNTDTQMDAFFQSAAASAQKLGVTIKDITESSTTFARLGYNTQESSDLAEYTAMLTKVGDIETQDATDAITAVVKAFGLGVDDVELVMDQMVEAGNNFPISVKQIAEGVTNAAAIMATAGNSFEETIALLTAANTTTQNAAKSSTGLRTIAARLRNTKTELDDLGESMTTSQHEGLIGSLTDAGVAITDVNGEFRSTYDVLHDLSKVWDDLNNMDQSAIIEALAGKRVPVRIEICA